jgi:hypothetical protein
VSPGGLTARLDDAFNPIVVKELRQAVKGKFVTAILLLLLAIQLIAVGLYIISGDDVATRYDSGRNAFMILHGLLLGICLLFVPTYTAIRLALERSDTNVDLLFITTIRPRSIIAGKIIAAVTVTILIFSACMPFMVFTYWLRGIDLPSIFVSLALSFLVVVTAIHIATFIAAIPTSRVLKILLGVLGVCFLPQLFVVTLSSSFAFLSYGIGSQLGTWVFWGPATIVLMIALALIGVLFCLSVALITPISANRAMPVRLFISGMWLISGTICAILSHIHRDNAYVGVWGILSICLFFISYFVAVSERESLGQRVTRSIPAYGVRRFLAFFCFSGSASAIAWTFLMSVLTCGSVWIWKVLSPNKFNADFLGDALVWIAGLGLYGLAYSLTAALLRRRFLSKWLSSKHTAVVGIILMVVGCVAPFLFGYMLFFDSGFRSDDIGMWLVANPFALDVDSWGGVYLTFAGIWAALVTVLNAPWLADQIDNFHPPEIPAETVTAAAHG